MIEFTISYNYDHKAQRAGVMKSDDEDGQCKYAVRPIDPFIVKKFGKQVTIIKADGNYHSENHIDADYVRFFNALVMALKEQDYIERE